MSQNKEYHELYDRLLAEVAALHQSNRRRIRVGMRMLVAVTLGLMLLMFLAEGNKVFTLVLWIISMFAVAAYLIAVEYADYELQKKLEYVTQMEQDSLGALLELPELPNLPKLGGKTYRALLHHAAQQTESLALRVQPSAAPSAAGEGQTAVKARKTPEVTPKATAEAKAEAVTEIPMQKQESKSAELSAGVQEKHRSGEDGQ